MVVSHLNKLRMKVFIFLFLTLFFINLANSQTYTTRNGHIWFFSHTAVEDIEAHNYQAVSTLDAVSGDIRFTLPVRSFEFRIALMQEHFNENYMESDVFPEARFSGKIMNLNAVSFYRTGVYTVEVTGDLTIKGITRPVKTSGTLAVRNGTIAAKAKFIVSPQDYNISIPFVNQNRISRQIEVNVEVDYKPEDVVVNPQADLF